MLLKTGARPIELLALQRVYKYITKVKNMPNHQLLHLAWNVGCKLQNNHKSKILTSGWVVDIRKWFRRAFRQCMQYAIIEDLGWWNH